MLAFLKKDFLVLRKSCAVYLALLVFYVVFGAINGDFLGFNSFGALLIITMLPVTSLSYDERSKWDVYGMSLPVSRRMVVMSKYAFTWVAALCCAGISLLVTSAFALMSGEGLSVGLLVQPLGCVGIGLLTVDLFMPVMYRFGVEKGRYIIMGVVWAIVVVPMFAMKVFDVNLYAGLEGVPVWLDGGAVVAAELALAIVVTGLSMVLSIAIYERKELS